MKSVDLKSIQDFLGLVFFIKSSWFITEGFSFLLANSEGQVTFHRPHGLLRAYACEPPFELILTLNSCTLHSGSESVWCCAYN